MSDKAAYVPPPGGWKGSYPIVAADIASGAVDLTKLSDAITITDTTDVGSDGTLGRSSLNGIACTKGATGVYVFTFPAIYSLVNPFVLPPATGEISDYQFTSDFSKVTGFTATISIGGTPTDTEWGLMMFSSRGGT